MKKLLQWLSKCIIAGIIAIAILSLFSMLYYNNGIRKTSKTGATDYVWENRFYSLGYEGYAWGEYDEYGYNNVDGSMDDRIDILLMGSSQMNAYNVSRGYSTAYILNELLQDSELNQSVYNIGMEGHDFYACSDNFDDALKAYSPQRYVIMETMNIAPTLEGMEKVLTGNRVRAEAFDSGVLYYLQKIPYLRLLHKQLRDILAMDYNGRDETNNIESVEIIEDDKFEMTELVYEEELNRYMERLGRLADESDVVLIIFYLPSLDINNDGSMNAVVNSEDIAKFAGACQNYGIVFVDMSETFLCNYMINYEVPYGFSNTAINHGHLNRIGHKLVAEELFDTILDVENERISR